MSSPPTGPLAVDLNVLKLGTTEDPVCRDDVERALYALTGWQKPQALVDAALAVVDSYASGVKLGVVVPRRDGHAATVRCTRPHLDEHTCPVAVDPCAHGCRDAAEAHGRLSQELELEQAKKTPSRETCASRIGVHNVPTMTPVVTTCVSCLAQMEPTVDELVDATVATAHLAAVTARDTRALDQASRTMAPGKRVRTGVRNEPTMTPAELLQVEDPDVDKLTEAQRAARHTLMTQSQHCSTCGALKSLDDFYRDKARLTGHASRCKSCANAASTAWRRRGA